MFHIYLFIFSTEISKIHFKNIFVNRISDTEYKCWLHVGHGVSKENVIPFTEATLQHCAEKKELRDTTKKKKSKYDVIVLPKKADGISGYHASCYRYFCSVSVKATKSDELQGNAY